ncbi:hypothetical protein GOP47_0016766 [Adiantum capillus-veneris]|uniref:Uncharacterized protein n=1 Tax=Adiantum capillus-veneris TaxID=13818 RepID=A0A9D4UIB5_ADICA|nr:hypothetical protein GOP47_0016766 [Adiantum capillus-veneris]
MEVMNSCVNAVAAPFSTARGKLASSSSSRVSRPLRISCVGWDPEGVLGPPTGGHIARRTFQKTLEKDAVAREAFEKQVRLEKEARRVAREARVVPQTNSELVNFLLDTEAQDIEFEIARCRPRLNEEFFSFLQNEIGSVRFSVNQTKETEDRLVELEALNKVLQEGLEAYDKLTKNMLGARERLARLLSAQDKRATLLDMIEKNELDRSLLALLDENIAAATSQGQAQAVTFMEKIRGAVLKYITI